MLDTVRRYVRERFGRIAPKSTEDLSRTLVKQGQATREQATRIARDVVEWSKKNTEMLADLVQREVRQQISRLGVATKEEVTAVRKRLRALEGGEARPQRTAAKGTSAKRTAAKKPAAKRTAAKKPAADRPVRKRAAAKTPAPRKTPRRAKRA